MNRFFRTVYSTSFVYLCLTLPVVLATEAAMPFLAFSCLYFGLLLCLLPGVLRHLAGKERLFFAIGSFVALLGFLPIALWHCPMAHWVVHALGLIAAFVFLSVLRHRTTHRSFLSRYQFTLVLLLLMVGFVYLAVLSGIYRYGDPLARQAAMSLAMNNIVPYATVLLASGVLLLRGLRAQEGMADEQSFNRRQLRDTIVFALLVTLVFAADPFAWLQRGIMFLYNDVLKPSASFLIRLLDSLLKVMSVKDRSSEEVRLLPEPTLDPEAMPMVEMTETEPEHFYFEANDVTRTTAYVFIAAAVLILLIVFALQVRRLIREKQRRGFSRGTGYPKETRETLPREEKKGRAGRPNRRSRDPRERMRYLYSEFMVYLKRCRIPLVKTDTCGEIERRAERRLAVDPSALADLTALYEKARYRLGEAPSEADARGMKDLLDRIRKNS